jgi:hypothetical protein
LWFFPHDRSAQGGGLYPLQEIVPMIAISESTNPSAVAVHTCKQDGSCQDAFTKLLPSVRGRAQIAFRYLPAEARQEAIAATIAHAYVAFVRLWERGQIRLLSGAPLARYAVARVRDGRHVGTRSNARDICSIRCRRRHGIRINSLEQAQEGGPNWREAVVEDRKAGPADVAAARLDIEAWLASLPPRQRRLAEILATGESTRLAARRLGLSAGRISQLRRKLFDAWQQFQGEHTATAVMRHGRAS